jgi:hypothetical protein
MTIVRFNDLTQEQVTFITDGCGKKGGILNVPDWIFTASCAQHDFNYWLGGAEEDRKKADWQFYQAMLYDAEQYPWYRRYLYKAIAFMYYRAVRWFAGSFFYYTDDKRTLEDLHIALENNSEV